MQVEVETIPFIKAGWFCNQVVQSINTEENKQLIEAACESAKIRPQSLNWYFWNLIVDLHLKGEVLSGDYFELYLFSEKEIEQEVKFSDSVFEGKLIRLLMSSYTIFLRRLKSCVNSDKLLISAPSGTF